MSDSDRATAFETLVERYERDGWVVRTIDRMRQRATVQMRGAGPETSRDDLQATSPQRVPACRKLWVDSQGEVQATDVPC